MGSLHSPPPLEIFWTVITLSLFPTPKLICPLSRNPCIVHLCQKLSPTVVTLSLFLLRNQYVHCRENHLFATNGFCTQSRLRDPLFRHPNNIPPLPFLLSIPRPMVCDSENENDVPSKVSGSLPIKTTGTGVCWYLVCSYNEPF